MITINRIQKQFASKVLFHESSLQIGVRDRIGLIGPNGSGKTTLFRMVLGEEPVDEGEIQVARGVKMGYLPQEVISLRGSPVLEETLKGASGITSLQDKMKILEEELSTIEDPGDQERLAKEYGKLQEHYTVLGGYGLEAEAKRILFGLGFKHDYPVTVGGDYHFQLRIIQLRIRGIKDKLIINPGHAAGSQRPGKGYI